jgi:hypothetical protein
MKQTAEEIELKVFETAFENRLESTRACIFE